MKQFKAVETVKALRGETGLLIKCPVCDTEAGVQMRGDFMKPFEFSVKLLGELDVYHCRCCGRPFIVDWDEEQNISELFD